MLARTISLYPLAIIGVLMTGKVHAQSLERYVVSPYGDCQTIGLVQYLFTAGEPVTGVSQSSIPGLTMGFEQPIRRYVLAPTVVWLEGRRTATNIRLNWHTTTAEAGGQFVLLYRVPSGTWRAVERLAVTAEQFSYSYDLVKPDSLDPAMNQVFQVAQISRDGQLSKSNVLALRPSHFLQGDIVLYPNPANTYIILETQTELRGTLEIINSQGQQLERFELGGGQFALTLDLTQYPAGMYVMVLTQNGVRQRAQFQVLH